jgi:menaquinone-specific isochorismate synthase
VGGVPTKEAISWIIEHEALARGWYSAPIGWADASGDGEFVVALRSGLLRDGKAWVYAGAGIMADSDPEAEYAETELKMQALLGALHGDGR